MDGSHRGKQKITLSGDAHPWRDSFRYGGMTYNDMFRPDLGSREYDIWSEDPGTRDDLLARIMRDGKLTPGRT